MKKARSRTWDIRSTTVSTIIKTFNNVSFFITETISNHLKIWTTISAIKIQHFESSSCHKILVWMKMNEYLITWRDVAGRNWITTILSYQGWCTWTTVIDVQVIIAEKIGCLFLFFNSVCKGIGTYLQLECDSTLKYIKLISIDCPNWNWISQVKSSMLL